MHIRQLIWGVNWNTNTPKPRTHNKSSKPYTENLTDLDLLSTAPSLSWIGLLQSTDNFVLLCTNYIAKAFKQRNTIIFALNKGTPFYITYKGIYIY